jgi:hypothetical protein
MVNSKKREPTETELIAWAIPQIASGNYFVTDGAHGRELRISERTASVKEMAEELSHREPDPAWQALATQALRELRENCNFQTIKAAFVAVLGKNLGNLCSQQFEDASPSYELVLACLYYQERASIKNLQQLFVKKREGLGSGSGALAIESNARPEATSVAVETYYSDEVARLFPRLIKRAEQLRLLPTEDEAPVDVQNYLKEASKCYIYGRFIACLVVCRSAIDFALRDRLVKRGHGSDLESLRSGRKDTLKEVISLARSKFPSALGATLDEADDVKEKANEAVHRGPPDTETCKDMFIKTRGILRELYSIADKT